MGGHPTEQLRNKNIINQQESGILGGENKSNVEVSGTGIRAQPRFDLDIAGQPDFKTPTGNGYGRGDDQRGCAYHQNWLAFLFELPPKRCVQL